MQLATAPSIPTQECSAVCYSCSYESSDQASVCPRCSFPMITRSELSPAAGIRLADVLKRDSIRLNAPPLPGVHTEPRKAQQLAAARKARLARPAKVQGVAAPVLQMVEVALPSPRAASWNMLLVCISAVGIGVAVAAMQSVI